MATRRRRAILVTIDVHELVKHERGEIDSDTRAAMVSGEPDGKVGVGEVKGEAGELVTFSERHGSAGFSTGTFPQILDGEVLASGRELGTVHDQNTGQLAQFRIGDKLVQEFIVGRDFDRRGGGIAIALVIVAHPRRLSFRR